MKRIFQATGFSAVLVSLAFAQTPTSVQTSTETFRGVLMDASCQAIQGKSAAADGTGAMPKSTEVSKSSQIGGAVAGTASGAGASGSLSNTTNTGGTGVASAGTLKEGNDNTSPATTARTGTTSDQSGQAASNTAATPGGTGASGSASETNYSGSRAERSRSAGISPAGERWATEQETYRQCRVTGDTNSFALMSNGRLYKLDDAKNMMSKRVESRSSGDWSTVVVSGTVSGDRIRVTAVQ